jgi:hypothetical protein
MIAAHSAASRGRIYLAYLPPFAGAHARHVNCSVVAAVFLSNSAYEDCTMRYANQHEIEYLGLLSGKASGDVEMMDELRRRLDALRCYDQNFSESDWRPRMVGTSWPPESPLKLC